MPSKAMLKRPDPETPTAWIVERAGASGRDLLRAFGLTPRQRLDRILDRAGLAPARNWDSTSAATGPALFLRADVFYDERLVDALLASGDVLLCRDTQNAGPGEVLAARASSNLAAAADAVREDAASELPSLGPSDLVPDYNPKLRRFDPAYALDAKSEDLAETEKRIFAASYKGITDFVTKYVFPTPARGVVRLLAAAGIGANAVTATSYVLAAAVIFLFARGDFGLGLTLAWCMTFLDTVDGKLARVTLTSSRIGGFFDHALDLVHPPIWWWAFAVGLGLENAAVQWAMGGVVGGYLVGRILEGIFLAAFGMEIFTWRPFDAFFRGIVARRNPNLLLLSLGCLAAAPGFGYFAVALWTALCILVVAVRIVQAAACRWRGIPIRPWYEEDEAA
jgi:phosphatidylglycerophosphate synthase